MDSTSQHIDELYKIRHSLAHVLAQAVLQYRPGSKLGFGPPISDGCYYDFILSDSISEEDFPKIESLMRKIIKKDQRFYREEVSLSEAYQRLDEMEEPYKRSYAEELAEKQSLDELYFYRNGPFLDMCEGPHVESTKKIPKDAFKIRSISGAYWRGDSRNTMMTRIYLWAFETKEQLDLHIANYELAQQRDHKKLNKQLQLYALDPDDVGKGLPLWLPNGTVIRDALEDFAKELEFKAGFFRVATPHIAKQSLYYKTGHLPYYQDSMYPPMQIEDSDAEDALLESYTLRPMNCPHHHKVYASEPRSYRDLPLRLAEYGQVYRLEESGAISGLLRVRGMCMNDAHIYCTKEQIKSEIKSVIHMYQKVYETLGLTGFFVRFSKWDPDAEKAKEKYVDNPDAWAYSESVMLEVLQELELNYEIGLDEAAFYGPKLDIQFTTVTGREESVSTVQLDFAVPERMGLTYMADDGKFYTPYCIHRAPFSTHERFVAFLTEHYGGVFPLWLAPVQVRIITVSDQFLDYAESIERNLREHFVRIEVMKESETVSKKIKLSTLKKIPVLLILGEQEVQSEMVSLRLHGSSKITKMSLSAFSDALLRQIKNRTLECTFSAEVL